MKKNECYIQVDLYAKKRLIKVLLDIETEDKKGWGYIKNPFQDLKDSTYAAWVSAMEAEFDSFAPDFSKGADRKRLQHEAAEKKFNKYQQDLEELTVLGLVMFVVTDWGGQEHNYMLTDAGRDIRAGYTESML